MSSLNDQIRNIIHSPESEAAARGEVDSRTPGSFPTDDMNPHTSDDIKDTSSHHHERNKLHKANDPRGQTHGHSDSGVGIMEDTSRNERAATQEPVEQAYAPAAGESQNVSGNQQSHDDTAPGYDEKPEELGSTFGGATIRNEGNKQAEQPSNTVRGGKQKSTVDHPDPYWGNIEPGQQGHGVYNTVTGHGSKEDETRHHQNEKHDNQRSFPLVGGTGQHTAQESDPTRRTFDDTTSTATSQPEKATQEPATQQDNKKSNWDGPVGAAVLGAAGTSTYAAGRDRDQPHDDRNEGTVEGDTPRDKAIPQREGSSAGSSEASSAKKRGFLGGIFHRSDEDKEQRRLAKEQKKEEKLVSKEEERRLKAEGRRTEREHEHVDPAAAAAAATAMRKERDDHDSGERQFHEDGRRASWRQGDGPGVMHEDPRVQAPGPGARVARDVYNSKHPEEAQEPRPLEGFAPHEAVKKRQLEGNGTSNPQEGESTSSANQGAYNTLSSGTPSGVRTGSSDVSRNTASEDKHHDRNRDAALAGTGAAAAGAAGYGAHKHHDDKKDREAREQSNTSTTTTTTTTSTTQNPESHHGRDAALAGTGLAGAGAAGYGAHKLHDNRQERDTQQQPDALSRERKDDGYNHLGTGTASGVRTDNTTSSSARDQPTSSNESHTGRNAALAGTGLAGAGAAAYGAHEYANRDKQKPDDVNRSQDRSHPQQSDSAVPIMAGTRHPASEAYSNSPSSNTVDTSNKRNIPAASDRVATTHIPDTTEEANQGHYNKLSSGTPSGINLDEHSHGQSKTSSDLPPVSESSHKGAYGVAGAGGLAAAGAGTAAYLNRKDSRPEELREGEREKVAEEEARLAGQKQSAGDCSATSMLGSGRGQKVTHTCTECGADQDISKYFNKSQ